MASSASQPDRLTEKLRLTPSRRVRIIGKIRPFTNQESESSSEDSKPRITLRKPQDGNRVFVSFLDQSARYMFIQLLDFSWLSNSLLGVHLLFFLKIDAIHLELLKKQIGNRIVYSEVILHHSS